MDRYIGLDVHASSTTIAVVGPSGKRLGSQVVQTNGEQIVQWFKSQSGTLHVCLEETTQSEWLYQILSPHAHQVVVAGVGASAVRGNKDDARDAFGLAEQLRTGSIETVVYKPTGCFGTLRQLCRAHRAVVGDSVSPARWPEQLGLLIDCDQTGTADSADCPDAARPPRSGPLCRAPPSADDGDRVVELDGPTDTDD